MVEKKDVKATVKAAAQAAQPAEGLHDGDDGIGMDDLKGNTAVCVIIAGRIIVKVFFIFIEIDHWQKIPFLGDPYPSGRMKRRILAAIGSVCNALYHDRSGFTIWGLADFLGIFTFGFSERKPLEGSGPECYNETARLLARLWHQPEKTDRKSGKPCRQIRQQKRRDTTC